MRLNVQVENTVCLTLNSTYHCEVEKVNFWEYMSWSPQKIPLTDVPFSWVLVDHSVQTLPLNTWY